MSEGLARIVDGGRDARPLLLDGAMGTMIDAACVSRASGCCDMVTLTAPDVIESIHRQYLAAGADIVTTNTFNATEVGLHHYGLSGYADDINVEGVRLARRVADEMSSAGRPRFVAGVIGPTAIRLSRLHDDMEAMRQTLTEGYTRQAKALIEGGADLLLIETVIDHLTALTAVEGVLQACRSSAADVPLIVSVSPDIDMRLYSDVSMNCFVEAVRGLVNPLAFGLNCGPGPELMVDFVADMPQSVRRLAVYPNIGFPDSQGRYNLSPQAFARLMSRLVDNPRVAFIGGCCGTTPAHIAALASLLGPVQIERV